MPFCWQYLDQLMPVMIIPMPPWNQPSLTQVKGDIDGRDTSALTQLRFLDKEPAAWPHIQWKSMTFNAASKLKPHSHQRATREKPFFIILSRCCWDKAIKPSAWYMQKVEPFHTHSLRCLCNEQRSLMTTGGRNWAIFFGEVGVHLPTHFKPCSLPNRNILALDKSFFKRRQNSYL